MGKGGRSPQGPVCVQLGGGGAEPAPGGRICHPRRAVSSQLVSHPQLQLAEDVFTFLTNWT